MHVDKRQQSSDVELENAVGIGLVAAFETTGLKLLIEFELVEQGEIVGGRGGHKRSVGCAGVYYL